MSETTIEQTESDIEGAQDGSEDSEPEITEQDANEQADTDDDFEAGEPDTQAAPPAVGLSEAEIEKRYKALEREQKRHTDTVSKVLGDDATELIVCPLCEPELQGFLRMESFDHPRDEIHAAMIEVLKKPAQVVYRNAPHAVECQDCNGLGKVLSGSRVPANETIVCPTCKGAGYLTAGGSTAPTATLVPTSEYVPSGLAHEPLEDERDEFGSPRTLADGRDNPNFGKTMRYKDPNIENEYLTRLSGVA